ncbi:PIH1 domain-containing protein, putative [Plasmodium malariae]|uniref:PIH1 domain-containing protein, putative n=1 Tax=Plasmodium malariae TaxID=5858 RepID=A0A1A8WGE0_PLAMA|nr:PIH1 domain-containing protein, putative [Plasmodium malariae]SBS91141.1 PIH1 domain-containing protein, putative (PIH1) [Plasmodium malariae]SBT81029.1 PIH1 domain-containing protein, putative [Plasmodium malariae]SCP03632.1 PIH1 domain-containing protein, putative [Plasmodium malariae]
MYEQYITQRNKHFQFSSDKLNDLVKNEKTIKISPQKGFVIKTYEKDGGKVYFNICSSNLIAEFHFKKIPDLNDQEGLRIPLSIGEEKVKEDKKGNKYKTYDIVLNTKVVVQSNNPDDQCIKDDQQHKFNFVEENEGDNKGNKISSKGSNNNNNSYNGWDNCNDNGDISKGGKDIDNYLTVKKPEWDMWFVNKKVLEDKHKTMEKFYLPYVRMFPLDDAIDAFDFKPPFLNSNEKKNKVKDRDNAKEKGERKKQVFKSFLNDYNIELDDEFLSYEQVLNTICVIQVQLPFFILAERSKTNPDDVFALHQFVNLYISDDHLSIFFKKSPFFPLGYNPPYKNFNIRFPFYFESANALSQYLEKYHLLNIIIPVSKNSAASVIFKEITQNAYNDVSPDNTETSDSSIF